jgi:hypothetical protein
MICSIAPVVTASAEEHEQASLVFPPYLHSYGIRKATPKHLFMFFGPLTSFDNPQGLATAKMVSRDDPSTEKDDDEVVVYGVNAGRHELIYNTSMWGLDRYGKKGGGEGELLHPRGIACDPHGNVYVADSGNNRVVHLFNPKHKVKWVRSYSGPKDDRFQGPTQVAIDEDGRIYVSDTKNSRIVVLDTTGKAVRKIGPATGVPFVDGPTTLAVADGRARWSYYRKERLLFCADRGGERLWKLAQSGAVMRKVNMPKGHRAHYGAIDYYHNFWVTDIGKHCVVKFDHDLKLLDVFGSRGTDDNQFIEPRGIAIWKRYGQTFIAEEKGAQYYWIGTKCTKRSLACAPDAAASVGRRIIVGADPGCALDLYVTEYSYVSLFSVEHEDTVYYMRRRFARAGAASMPCGPGVRRPLQPGAAVTLRVEPTYSSYTYYQWHFPLTVGTR